MHVSSQYDAAGKGSVQSCSCCQWSPVCRDFLPSVHPGGLLSARGAGGDPAQPPVSHLWFLLNQRKALLPGCRKSWAHTAAYMAWFLKPRKREVRFSLAPCPVSKCHRASLAPWENSHPGRPMFSAWRAALTAHRQQNAWAGRARPPSGSCWQRCDGSSPQPPTEWGKEQLWDPESGGCWLVSCVLQPMEGLF